MHIDAKLVNCDLCILAYQNYHQSVIWPLDPTGRSIPSSPAFTGDGSKFLVLQAAKYVTDSLRRVKLAHCTGPDTATVCLDVELS
jgi:hypothetical protein